jgi:hypothetical protein
MMKQVITVIEKGTEPVEKSAILSFAFMAIKADGKILLEVFGVSMVVTSLRNHSFVFLVISCLTKIELRDGSIAVSSEILEKPEDDQCWSKHVCIQQ